MNVMVIGGGGREPAIVRKLRESPDIDTLYALPGNGGMEAVCVPVGAKDLPAIEAFAASHDIGFAVVAPDDPLALGAVDRLEAAGEVVRVPSQTDRRQIDVRLTPADRQTRKLYADVSREMSARFYRGIAEADIDRFERTAERILANLEDEN